MPPLQGLMQFILASESARRVDLLNSIGYRFQTVKSGFQEVSGSDPQQIVEENARGKVGAVARLYPTDVVLGADTVVYLPEEGVIFEKAEEADDVRNMLSALQGRRHEVHTGVAVVKSNRISFRHSMTIVEMRQLSEQDIEAYVTFGEGVGKAGGYAIQGTAALFIDRIEGDYSNVVGLPLTLAARMLEHVGVGWYENEE